jgi:hypothetical protein
MTTVDEHLPIAEYSFRRSLLESERQFRLYPDFIVVESEKAGRRRVPLDCIQEVNLLRHCTRQRDYYQCRLRTDTGGEVFLQHLHVRGILDFEDRSSAYVAFVRALLSVLARNARRVEFRSGSAADFTAVLLYLVFVTLLVLGLVANAVLLPTIPAWLMLPVGVYLIWRWGARLGPALPRNFHPAAPPPSVLPPLFFEQIPTVLPASGSPDALPGPDRLEQPPVDPNYGKGLAGLSHKYSIQLGEWFRRGGSHWGAVLGPMIGFSFLLLLFGVVAVLIPFVGWGLLVLLLPALLAGFTVVALAQLKGKRWTFGAFFGGFRWYWPILAHGMLTAMIFLACLLPGVIAVLAAAPERPANQAPDEPFPPAGPLFTAALVFALLNLLVAACVHFRCVVFAWPLIIDRGCGPVQALRGSWTLSKGHFWSLLGISLLLSLINFGGGLLLGIGMLFTFPLTRLVFLAGYLLSTETRSPAEVPSVVEVP